MKVQIKIPIVGPGQLLLRNKVYDLSEKQARELISVRYATAVDEPAITAPSTPAKRREKASVKPSEIR